MGAWGRGPFENDGAADFLSEIREGAVEAMTAALQAVADTRSGQWIEVDEGEVCVAACELVVLAFGQDDVPATLQSITAQLETSPELVRLALRALPRVLDDKHSELAGLWRGDPGPFERLYDRLLELGDGPPLVDVGALLRTAPEPEPQPVPSARPRPRSGDGLPDIERMINSSPALRAGNRAHGTTWSLEAQGILNIFGDLSDADCVRLEKLPLVQVQFARRFEVSSATLQVVDRLLMKYPGARLLLVLNGYGAFDDLEVLARLPHLRKVAVNGQLTANAAEVLVKYPQLDSAFVNGTVAERA